MQQKLQFLNVGDQIDLRVSTKGADWSKVTDVIGGGPQLIKNGKVAIMTEGFNESFSKTRHPRTAIGRTKEGDVWILTVDGRQTMSGGASLEETAWLMFRLGCIDAINLDGGGSTTLNIRGLTLNRPSDGSERPVANALVVFSPAAPIPVFGEPTGVIAGPATVQPGQKARFRLVDHTGADVDPAEVLWSAQGAGWIDQGGYLTGAREGNCTIKAFARGALSILTVEVKKGP
jgi:hypothetical protein